MIKPIKRARPAAMATAVVAIGLSSFATAPASATAPSNAQPVPACVAMYESWRYIQAFNGCADTQSVLTVYRDGATGLCSTVPRGALSTVGEGYLGQHGHADHLALCDPLLTSSLPSAS
ncbi:hypothetical protein [Streptomyces sp. NPDC057403]|uniref:hypothetical protein n=1 Tax=Streptomyces sp. NPDC057403 TaxID=3346119 RepID=UPI0036BAC30A